MNWYSIAQALGAPPGKSEEYYKNWVLNLLFILPAIFSGLFVIFGVFNTAFFVCIAMVGVIVFFSSERRVLLGTTLAFLALRFAIGVLIPRQGRILTSLLLSVAFAAAAAALFWWRGRERRDYGDPHTRDKH